MEHHSLDVSIACKPSVGSPTGRRMAPRSFFAEAEAAAAGADLPQFVKDEFDAFLECGILPKLVTPVL